MIAALKILMVSASLIADLVYDMTGYTQIIWGWMKTINI